tara:strand:+ start:99 stop:212 length:114 start_codon:yes stop_codon:yes gene_type:complete
MPKRKNKNNKPMILGISITLGTLKNRRKKKNVKKTKK